MGTIKIIAYLCVSIKHYSIMAVGFFIRSKSSKADTMATIWARIRSRKVEMDFRTPTPYSIAPGDWNADRRRPKNGKAPEVKKALDKLEEHLETFIADRLALGKGFTPDEIRVEIENVAEGRKKEAAPSGIAEFVDFLIGQMKSGDLKFKGNRIDEDTAKAWVVFRNILVGGGKGNEGVVPFLEYERKRQRKVITWESIDQGIADDFVTYCQKVRGFLPSTINKCVISWRALIRYSGDRYGIHNNLKAAHYFNKVQEPNTTRPYLTEEELAALLEMPLDGLRAQVRDVFCIGILTAQRVSDYANLNRSNLGYTARGIKVLRIRQEKTNQLVTVPVGPELEAILERYDYQPPHIGAQILNRYVKVILRDLSESVESLKTPFVVALSKAERDAEKAGKVTFERNEEGEVIRPKYELITTHTARRTGATLMHLGGILSDYQIRAITGHKTESIFNHYLSQSGDEIAEEIAAAQKAAKEGNE